MQDKYILLIEDNKAISDSLAWAIGYENYSIIAKFNGLEALDFLEKHHNPSVILLDMMMPIMDGWQFRDKHNQNARLRNIPTLLMSGKREFDKEINKFPNEILLPKPFNINELLGLIKEFSGD